VGKKRGSEKTADWLLRDRTLKQRYNTDDMFPNQDRVSGQRAKRTRSKGGTIQEEPFRLEGKEAGFG